MATNRRVWIAVVATVLLLGVVLALQGLSLTPAAKGVIIVFVGILAAIAIVVAGFIWWIRKELADANQAPEQEFLDSLESNEDES